MTAPLKPWERAGVNSRAFSGDFGAILPTPVNGIGGSSGGLGTGTSGPPLPPRVPGTTINNPIGSTNIYTPNRGYSSYTSPYSYNSGGGYGSYGSYGGYGGFGGSGFGGGYNSYGSFGRTGFGVNQENRFIAAAEESSQPAFQSLESIVQAFGSISMMLESTLSAVYSSFRAVLGMADQFSRLRQVFSALAIFRTAKWAYHKLLYIVGLQKQNPHNTAWASALSSSDPLSSGILTEADLKKNRSSWPITLFMAIIISAPYFIWRIISSLDNQSGNQNKKWAEGEGEHFIAVAEYDFNAGNEQELGFKAGQSLRLAPRSLQPRVKGWLLAAVDKQRIGLVPANYIRILSKQETSTPQ